MNEYLRNRDHLKRSSRTFNDDSDKLRIDGAKQRFPCDFSDTNIRHTLFMLDRLTEYMPEFTLTHNIHTHRLGTTGCGDSRSQLTEPTFVNAMWLLLLLLVLMLWAATTLLAVTHPHVSHSPSPQVFSCRCDSLFHLEPLVHFTFHQQSAINFSF